MASVHIYACVCVGSLSFQTFPSKKNYLFNYKYKLIVHIGFDYDLIN